jgi:hypothetical protein
MKRFIVSLAIVILLVTLIAPAAFAADSTTAASGTLVSGSAFGPQRACPDGSGINCSCPCGVQIPTRIVRWRWLPPDSPLVLAGNLK